MEDVANEVRERAPYLSLIIDAILQKEDSPKSKKVSHLNRAGGGVAQKTKFQSDLFQRRDLTGVFGIFGLFWDFVFIWDYS